MVPVCFIKLKLNFLENWKIVLFSQLSNITVLEKQFLWNMLHFCELLHPFMSFVSYNATVVGIVEYKYVKYVSVKGRNPFDIKYEYALELFVRFNVYYVI